MDKTGYIILNYPVFNQTIREDTIFFSLGTLSGCWVRCFSKNNLHWNAVIANLPRSKRIPSNLDEEILYEIDVYKGRLPITFH